MIVFLQLTTAGIDSGSFDLYSNFDYDIPFETGVTRNSLIAGYSTTVPDNATIVRITSKEDCISSVDITLRDVECDLEGYTGEITTTSTSTTTSTTTSTSTSSTTTTTTTAFSAYRYVASIYTCDCIDTPNSINFTNIEPLTLGKWYVYTDVNTSIKSKILIIIYQGIFAGANTIIYDIDKKDTCAELTCSV